MDEGKYHARVVGRDVFESQKTSTVGMVMHLYCYEKFNGSEFVPLEAGFVDSTTYIVGRDGFSLDLQSEALQQATGWDGTTRQWGDEEWKPNDVEVEVAWDTYEGKRTLKAKWISRILRDGEAKPKPPASQLERIERKIAAARELSMTATRDGTPAPAPALRTSTPAPTPAPEGEVPF